MLFSMGLARAQRAVVSGVVHDASGAVIPNATITLTETAQLTRAGVRSNGSGFYSLSSVMPGEYSLIATAPGFSTEMIGKLEVNVGAYLAVDFTLKAGAKEQIIVTADIPEINTTNASVSTVINRNLVQNLPLNGRSVQSLITISPGTAVVPSSGVGQSGEISVNGQRTEANSYTVDGISANTGASVSPSGFVGAGFSGATPQESAIGTTQGIVSIEALEEFRASTSSYAAEFGRTPGGQFNFSTRSGTNQWHGSAFDYLRNTALDSMNRFDVTKLPEHQNDFGGTIGGPVWIPKLYDGKDRTFFFFAFEGLRLTQPQASALYQVPDACLRSGQSCGSGHSEGASSLLPFLNAFPQPNGTDFGNGLAGFTSGYSAPSKLDMTSLRVDHDFGERMKIFGRASYVPSESQSRQPTDLSEVLQNGRRIGTLVVGADSVLSSRMADTFRFGLTGNDSDSNRYLDSFGGATALSTSTLPGFQNSDWLTFFIFYGLYPYYLIEPQSNQQDQINIVNSLSRTMGRQNWTFGVDFRRLLTSENLPPLREVSFYSSEPSLVNNTPAGLYIYTQDIEMKDSTKNLSLFAQDDWKVSKRLSLSYGLRWDLNPAPTDIRGNTPYTLNQVTNLATAALATKNSPLYKTSDWNLAPRMGAAYVAHATPGSQTVFRVGAGLFYDVGNTLTAEGYYGVGSTGFLNLTGTGASFPVTAAQVASAPLPSASAPYNATVFAYDPQLKLPYTGEWNAAIEQGLGSTQSLTLSYVASVGRRLLVEQYFDPYLLGNQAFSGRKGVNITRNLSSSYYNSLQVKFDRKMSRNLQLLASYTWAHDLDDDSSNFLTYELERGPSDYDVRNNFQAALVYNVNHRVGNRAFNYVLSSWGLGARVSARSALPVDIVQSIAVSGANGESYTYHPDRSLGVPLYNYGAQYPGGRAINFNAFTSTGGTEGNAGRNSARGFNAVQADLTLSRDFRFTEHIGLQLRTEAYNALNHPIYGGVYNSLADGTSLFGLAYNTENSELGGLSALYQVGGPRSLQVSLRLHF